MRVARKRNPKRDKAFEIFKKHEGNITNRAIAQKLDVNEKTLSVWKYRDKWNDKLGEKNKNTTDKKRSTSKQKKKPDDLNVREIQRERIVKSLKVANSYSPALEVLIDVYLDCFLDYEYAKENGLETTESLRKEMARLLGQLGLNINNRALANSVPKKDKKEDEKPKQQPQNKLVQFRQRMTK